MIFNQSDASIKKIIITANGYYYTFTEGTHVCAFDYINPSPAINYKNFYFSIVNIQYFNGKNAYKLSLVLNDSRNTLTNVTELNYFPNFSAIVYYI